ncbi:MAG TPA: helix-turn-helix transcriptional regulator, partial [Stellaceae bacterium]|nr:helix-turn-helix transcriptional regulator [Stellaceae bacterium]
METRPKSRRRALGDFLRTHRARLSPASLALAAGGRRRTPGLRREEVAQAAGLSATWYTWLEQGRDISASPEALAALAAALQLTPAERAYLFELAGRRDPAAPSAPQAMDVPPALAAAVAAIGVPAYVLDRCWTARAWNAPAARLFLGWLDAGEDKNLLRYVFLSPLARRVIPDWPLRARRVLAEFRAESSRHLEDPALVALVEELRRKSPLFARGWSAHEVVERAGGERRFDHPRVGSLAYEQTVFA